MNRKTLVNFIDIMTFIILILVGVFYLYKISYGANSFIMEKFVFPLVSTFFVFLTGIRTGFAIYKARDNKIVGPLGRLLYGKEKSITPRVRVFNVRDEKDGDVVILNNSEPVSKSEEENIVIQPSKQVEVEKSVNKPVLDKYELSEKEVEEVEKAKEEPNSPTKDDEINEFIINKSEYF